MKGVKKEARANKARDIVQATYSVILEQGYCNASTSMIAQKAGITKSMLHYYFKDKGVLMLETHRYAIQNMITIIRESAAQHATDPDGMDKRIIGFWETVKKNIEIMIVLYATSINSLNDHKMRMEFGGFYGMILAVVKEKIAAGYKRLNMSAKDAEAVASIIIGVMESLIHHYMVNPDITDFDYSVKMLIRIITNGIPISLTET